MEWIELSLAVLPKPKTEESSQVCVYVHVCVHACVPAIVVLVPHCSCTLMYEPQISLSTLHIE